MQLGRDVGLGLWRRILDDDVVLVRGTLEANQNMVSVSCHWTLWTDVCGLSRTRDFICVVIRLI